MTTRRLFFVLTLTFGVCAVLTFAHSQVVIGTESPAAKISDPAKAATEDAEFSQNVQPVLKEFCQRCHNADNMKSGVRVDQLQAVPEDRHLKLIQVIEKLVTDGSMPPADEPQPSEKQRKQLNDWITRSLFAARSRSTPRNGSFRRLTVAQYRNTLRDLLGLEENLTDVLPPDSVSKDGFVNNTQTMLLSPMQIEMYFNIAEKALDLCIVDEQSKPVIQNFRMELGRSINPQPCPDKLILGANSELLNNADFVVTELKPVKPFEYQPFAMKSHFDFIEGYVGNDTIRAWKSFDSIYHAVFACMRGSPGYPKGEAYETIPEGLLLRPAIPSPEIFGQSNTYGPMANFKISLRELPDGGNFKITVKAARYDDGMLLDPVAPIATQGSSVTVPIDAQAAANPLVVHLPEQGIYQIDVITVPGSKRGQLSLDLGSRSFKGQLFESKPERFADGSGEITTAYLLLRLQAGEHRLAAHLTGESKLRGLRFTKHLENSELARRFAAFEKRTPSISAHIGLRRDCGSTMNPVGTPQVVKSTDFKEFVFTGAISNYPNPDVEKDNVNYLAGVREIGVRSEYTDGRDMPRLLIRSVEFEGPYYDNWPPQPHRRIFIDSSRRDDPRAYATEILGSFAKRAFRRPVTDGELESLVLVWKTSFDATQNFTQSIKDATLVALTSPQFLFLIENSATPDAEDLDADELASKLSYTLWNTIPDDRLTQLASQNSLHQSLDAEIDRMLGDPRSAQFLNEFVSQWLSLDKFDVVAVDAKRFPRMTRDAKVHLRQEPIELIKHMIAENLPVRNLVQSDFIVADEVVASYYDLGDRTESGFHFVPIAHGRNNLGGVLTSAAILSGLSDGRESNPIKRGAWMARKIVAEPPDDPPPNVPRIKEDDDSKLTLREKLEQHRNQQGCYKCHSGIDPWGLPFEQYDAGGLIKTSGNVESRSKLPDGTEVGDVNALKAYLANDRIDQIAFSFMKHFACYATGRSLSYNEIAWLREHGLELQSGDYRMRDLIRLILKSDLFLKK